MKQDLEKHFDETLETVGKIGQRAMVELLSKEAVAFIEKKAKTVKKDIARAVARGRKSYSVRLSKLPYPGNFIIVSLMGGVAGAARATEAYRDVLKECRSQNMCVTLMPGMRCSKKTFEESSFVVLHVAFNRAFAKSEDAHLLKRAPKKALKR